MRKFSSADGDQAPVSEKTLLGSTGTNRAPDVHLDVVPMQLKPTSRACFGCRWLSSARPFEFAEVAPRRCRALHQNGSQLGCLPLSSSPSNSRERERETDSQAVPAIPGGEWSIGADSDGHALDRCSRDQPIARSLQSFVTRLLAIRPALSCRLNERGCSRAAAMVGSVSMWRKLRFSDPVQRCGHLCFALCY